MSPGGRGPYGPEEELALLEHVARSIGDFVLVMDAEGRLTWVNEAVLERSGWTREDGAYVIYVPEPGVYYVGARTGFMGVPRPDEPYGRYDGAKDHSVKVGQGGFVDGVDVTLKRFSDSR